MSDLLHVFDTLRTGTLNLECNSEAWKIMIQYGSNREVVEALLGGSELERGLKVGKQR